MRICKNLHQFEGQRCLECRKNSYRVNKLTILAAIKAQRAANPDKHRASSKAWVKANPERARTLSLAWQKANPQKARKATKAWTASNPEKAKKCARAWVLSNIGKVNATAAKRRAAKLKRTPKWLTQVHHKEIERFYAEAAQLTRETGISHEVDHIVPLQGKTVSGLHVPWNLQILTSRANSSKNNRF